MSLVLTVLTQGGGGGWQGVLEPVKVFENPLLPVGSSQAVTTTVYA